MKILQLFASITVLMTAFLNGQTIIMGQQNVFGRGVTIINGQTYPANLTVIKEAGKSETKKVDISGVRKIDASGIGNLTIEQCITCPEILTITADENIMPYLKHDASDRKLHLGFKNLKDNIIIETITPINFHAVVNDINKISTQESVNTTLKNIETNMLALDMSGASTLYGSINVNELKADLSGATQATLHGKANNQKVDLAGAAQYNAQNLSTQATRIRLAGAAQASIYAMKNLNYKASGASTLLFRGNARIEQGSTFGAARAKKF